MREGYPRHSICKSITRCSKNKEMPGRTGALGDMSETANPNQVEKMVRGNTGKALTGSVRSLNFRQWEPEESEG